jgi:hypothetical protein
LAAVNRSLDTVPANAPAPADDFGAREATLIAHVRETFMGTDDPRNVIIASEGERSIRVLPFARSQLALFALGGTPLLDLVASLERPAEPHILAVLVFTDQRIGLAWFPLTFAGFTQRSEAKEGSS